MCSSVLPALDIFDIPYQIISILNFDVVKPRERLDLAHSSFCGMHLALLIFISPKHSIATCVFFLNLKPTLFNLLINYFRSSVRVSDGKKVFFPGRRKKPVQNLFFPGFFRFLPSKTQEFFLVFAAFGQSFVSFPHHFTK